MNDLRFAWRQLQFNRGFAVSTIGVLTLGMSATVTAFSVVTGVLWHPLPVPDSERVVAISERHGDTTRREDLSAQNFVELRARVRNLEQLSAAEPFNVDFSTGTHPEVVKAGRVTAGFFEAFGVPAAYGRVFGPQDYQSGHDTVAVLTWRFWREQFHADPGAVGAVIQLDGQPHTIVGVLPDHFETATLRSYARRQLFTPKAGPLEGRVQVVARLPAGMTLDVARAELDALEPQLAAARTDAAFQLDALPIREHVFGTLRPALLMVGAAIALVLLLTCVNVANLLLARSFARSDEFAVRLALGANRRRLIAHVFAESLLLASFAGLLSMWLASAAVRGLARVGPANVPFLDSVSLDVRAVLLAMVLVPLVAALASVIPALRVAYSTRHVSTARTSTDSRDRRAWRSALVISQIALALVLVTGATLLLRSFSNLVREDVGFKGDRVAVLQVMAWSRQPGPEALRRFFDEAQARLAILPGVEAVGAVSAMPFIEANIDIRSPLTLVGRPSEAGQPPSMVSVTVVTPGYFEAVGGRLLQGRLLDARDAPGRAGTALISEALALRHFRGRNPIGSRIEVSLQRRPRVVEVVGVVASFRHEGLDAAPRAEVFLPHAQAPFGAMTFVLRTGMDPAAVLGPARAAIWSIDPQQSFYQTGTLQQLVGETVAARRFTLWVIGVFAGLSLALAAAGVYGVLSTVVVLYGRELGIRIALGASTLRVVGIVLGRGMRMAVAGVAIGSIAAAAGSRLLRGFLHGVDPIDLVAFAGAAGLMLTVTGIASYLPARRAAATDPARVLGLE